MTYSQELMDAFSQVGKFLYHFSLMEAALDECIGKVLDLDGDQIEALSSVIPLWKKVELFQDIIYSQKTKDESWRKQTGTRFNALGRVVNDRNIVAHHRFEGHSDQSITFFTYKLQKKDRGSSAAQTVWSSTEFSNKITELQSARIALKQIVTDLEPVIHAVASVLIANSTMSAVINTVQADVTPPIASEATDLNLNSSKD